MKSNIINSPITVTEKKDITMSEMGMINIFLLYFIGLISIYEGSPSFIASLLRFSNCLFNFFILKYSITSIDAVININTKGISNEISFNIFIISFMILSCSINPPPLGKQRIY